MLKPNSYVYFAFKGDNIDPNILTAELGIKPTDSWRTREPEKHTQQQKYSCWQLKSTSDELLDVNKLVSEVVTQLSSKIELINSLKEQYNLDTVLEIVMYIDINEEQSSPFLGHSTEVISFLHRTGTTTDVDIYRYDSTKE